MKTVREIGQSKFVIDSMREIDSINKSSSEYKICEFKKPKAVKLKGIKKANYRNSQHYKQNAIGHQSQKCVIFCPEEKVKQYTEIIKNSNMNQVAVLSNSKTNTKKNSIYKYIVFIFVGLLIGFANGFFGGGGGMLCVPLLIYALGLKDKVAHATALLIMLPISLVSIIVYISNLSIDISTTLYVMIGSIVGGILGSLLLKKLSNGFIRGLFAIIMIVAGIRMIL